MPDSDDLMVGSLLLPADLSKWLGEPIVDEIDKARAEAVLSYAFTLIDTEIDRDVAYWVEHGLPSKVRNVALAAAGYGYTNPDSFRRENIDDWGGDRPVKELGMYLTATQKAILRSYSASPFTGIGVLDTYRESPVSVSPWFDTETGGINDWPRR